MKKLANKNSFDSGYYYSESLKDFGFKQMGEKGTSISDVQLQRITIAKALYNKPEMIIFDEATNSLDPKNENEIINLIKSYTDITVIFISHNWELLKDGNKVLNL